MDYWYTSALFMHCLEVSVQFSSVTSLSMLSETKTHAQVVFQSIENHKTHPSPHKSHTYLECLSTVFKAGSASSPAGW